VDGHHVVPWSRGGATALGNLCSLCRRHHGYVHEFGFRLEPDGADAFRWFRPDGAELPVAGGPAEIGWDPIGALRAEHQARGLVIDAGTNAIGWDGRPADYDLAVWLLMPSQVAEL
jgi:HNH endonuclease